MFDGFKIYLENKDLFRVEDLRGGAGLEYDHYELTWKGN